MTSPAGSPLALVVEDDAGIRETVAEILACDGWRVTTACDGAAGLAAARQTAPDLIISDIVMPGGDGYSLLAELRRDPILTQVPVIFLTARAGATELRRGMEQGADDYLVKPFDPEALLRAARSRLKRRRAIEAGLAHFQQAFPRSLPHDLRSLLGGVLGYADLLMEEAREAGDQGHLSAAQVCEHAGHIHLSGQRLLRLIERYALLIQLSSPEHEMLANSETWSCSLSVLQIEERARSHMHELGRQDDLQLSLEPAALAVPPDLLPCVVHELIDNACKFSRPGSVVAVQGRIDGQIYRLTITDAGCGMPPDCEHLSEAHTPLARGTGQRKSAGLGLAIAKRFSVATGGSLTFARRAAGGTCVHLLVPTSLESAGPATEVISPNSPPVPL